MSYPYLANSPVRSTRGEQYIFTCQFETNATSAPDGVDPEHPEYTVARSGTGTYTITFAEKSRPLEMHYGHAVFAETDAGNRARVSSYVPSTGVLTVQVHLYDGTPATDDTTDKTIQVFCVFTRSSYAQ